jgi:hypothetical protein
MGHTKGTAAHCQLRARGDVPPHGRPPSQRTGAAGHQMISSPRTMSATIEAPGTARDQRVDPSGGPMASQTIHDATRMVPQHPPLPAPPYPKYSNDA